MTRIGSPTNYACKRSQRAGMHKWFHNADGFGECRFCGLVLDAEDTRDVFTGPTTPIGQLRLGRDLLDSRDDDGDD